MDYLYYMFIVLAFVAVVLLLEGLFLAWNATKGSKATSIAKRLQAISAGWNENIAESENLIKQRLLSESPAFERILAKTPRVHSLDRFLVQANVQFNVASFIGYILLSMLGGLAIAALFQLPLIISLACMLLSGLIPVYYVNRERSKRLLLIEEQLPNAIDLMARALKAGHAFSASLQMVAEEAAEPLADQFRLTFEEINYGISVQSALMNLSTRIPITDLRYFVVAVLIQRESGGNLAELLEKISNLIRERLKLLGRIRVLSAEGRLSGWILSCLPFFMAFVINTVNPGFLNVLFTDPVGHTLIGIACVMMIIGIYVMSRIIKIRV